MENEVKKEAKLPMRQIIIETDGNIVHLRKAEVGGVIELTAILGRLIEHINTPQKESIPKSDSQQETKKEETPKV